MNINLTLIGQSITFAFFVWFCMKFVWPPITNALHERNKKIADGLAAGERGQKDLELAKTHAVDIIKQSKGQAAEIIVKAEKRAAEIVDEAKALAREEGDRLIHAAKAEIEQEANRAKEVLRGQVVKLAIVGAEKLIEKEINEAAHSEMLNKLAAQL